MGNVQIFSRRAVKTEKAGWTRELLNKIVYPDFDTLADNANQADPYDLSFGFDSQRFNSMAELKVKFEELSGLEIGIDPKDMVVDRVSVDNHPTLFLDFADLELMNPIATKRFIQNFGLLFPTQKDISVDQSNNSEPLAAWIFFQLELKNLILIWRQFVGRTADSKPFLFHKVDDEITDGHARAHFAYNNFPSIEQIRPKQTKKPKESDTYEFLATSFNRKLKHLIYLASPNYALECLPRLDAPLMKSVGSFVHHETFLGALLQQFVDAVENGKKFTRCLECGAWMESSNKGKIYDTPSCKASAGRRRRELSLLFEVMEDFGGLISRSLKEHFELRALKSEGNSVDDFLVDQLFEFFENEGVKKELAKRLLDLLLNTQKCLDRGANFKLVVDHLGLGEEAEEVMQRHELATFLLQRPEFQTAYYDWSWGLKAFENDPIHQGIGSLLKN